MSFAQGAPTQPLNLIASNVFVTGTSAAGNAFTVQQLGVGNVASFQTSSGSTALIINPSGQVGIGLANPGTALQVVGTVTAGTFSGSGASLTSLPMGQATGTLAVANGGTGTTTSTGTGSVVLSANPTLTGTLAASSITASTSFTRTTGSTGTAFSAPGTGLASTDYNYILSGANDTANRLVIFVNGSTRTVDGGASNVTIRNDLGSLILGNGSYPTLIYGNVGIGTASPSYLLDVNGQSRIGNPALITDASTVLRLTTSSGASYIQSGTALSAYSVADIVFTGIFATPEFMRIKSTGNVGIGTTSPSFGLDVYGTSSTAGTIRAITSPQGSGVVGSQLRLMELNDTYGFAFQNINALRLGLLYYNGGAGVECMSVRRDNGNVGIGTTSPQAVLDVRNSALIGDYGASGFYNSNAALHIRRSGVNPHLIIENIGVSTGAIAGVASGMVYGVDGTFHAFRTGCSGDYPSTGTERMRINTTGVGIGTASPSSTLDIRGGNISFGSYDTTSAVRYVGIYNVNDGGGCLAGMEIENTTLTGNYSQKLHFRTHWYGTNNGRRLTISEAGNVGIGTATPAFRHHVYNGDSSFSYYGPNATWGAYLLIGSGTNNRTSGRAQIISTNGNLHMDAGTGQIMYLNYYSAGDGVGCECRQYGALNVTGDVTAFYSDERLKTKVGLIENPLDKVCSLTAFKYVHNDIAKSVGFEGDGVQVGLSAQEVQNILPEVVARAPFDEGTDYDVGKGKSKSGQDYLTLKYERLVPLLVEALKEERAERLRLQDRLERLEKLLSQDHTQ